MVGPTASLSTLRRADGSANYKCPTTGYSVTASVNSPVELPARKEALKPEEATIEVHVKPGSSSAAIGERYVEGIVRSVLENVVLVRDKAFARRGVVINLLIENGPTAERADSVSFFSKPMIFCGGLTIVVPYCPPCPPPHISPCSPLRRRSLVHNLCDCFTWSDSIRPNYSRPLSRSGQDSLFHPCPLLQLHGTPSFE